MTKKYPKENIKKESKPYCLMPWLHLHVSDNGYVKPCCVSNAKLGNVNTQNFDEIWHGESMVKLRHKFKSGIPDKRCFVCINREKGGVKSIRQETFDKYGHLQIENLSSPIYFDIRFSNICNFKCRTCWHGASSHWFADAKKLGRNISEKAIIKNIDDYHHFIQKFGNQLLQAKEIYFAGGEPLVTEEHYKLLLFLIKNNKTNLLLRYNTNFSQLKFKHYRVLDLWKEFSQVEVLASVDDMSTNGEMIRKGFNWNKFLHNRKLLKNMPHVSFKIAPTISLYNLNSLPAFYKYLLKQNIINKNDFYINILERPYHFNIKALPFQDKKLVTQNYQDFINWCKAENIPQNMIKSFSSIISFMNEEQLPEKHWINFNKETKMIDDLWQS